MTEAVRAEVLGMTDEEVVYGWHRGETSELIIVPRVGQQLVVLNSTVDPEGFRESVGLHIPSGLQESVADWLEQGD